MRVRMLALGGLLLAAVGASAQLGLDKPSGLSFVPRFTRLLRQDLSSVASYLVPNQQPSLCHPGDENCCQSDSYASPYGLTYLNSTQQAFGGRTYTTFFFTFHSNSFCNSALDNSQCCIASADNIWIDVDPALKVKYVAFNGQRLASAQQSEYGLRLGSVGLSSPSAATAGIPVAVTVEGAADALCPPPGLAPVSGLCELVIQGASPAGPGACCPATVSVTSTLPYDTPDGAFQCAAALDSSPFQLLADGASAPVAVDGGAAAEVAYAFRLARTRACAADAVGDCCNAQLSYVNLRVTNLPIAAVTLGGHAVNFSTSVWNEPNSASYRALVIDDLNLVADDLGASGLPLVITIRLPASAAGSAARLPDLCDPSPAFAPGACAYYLHSEDGFCCPSGLALPDDSVPPPPPGTCAPSQLVPAADASAALSYYERAASSSATTFTFLLANRNPPGGGCTKRYCVDVCSWTLYLDAGVAATLALGHESPANNGRQLVLPANGATGAPASVTFTYGPAGESTASFFLTLPAGGKSLADLCARNALPGQGGKACAAVVRSGGVYFMAFFDESDVVVVAPTPLPPVPLCAAPRPLADSCLAVNPVRYNALLTLSVWTFGLVPAPASNGACKPTASPGKPTSVFLVLNPPAVDQLATRGAAAVRPTDGLALDRNAGARWTLDWWAPGAPGSVNFAVLGAGRASDVCRQGVTGEQPAGSCVVEVSGNAGCFRGYVTPQPDGGLIWVEQPAGGSGGVRAGVVVPAVVVPAVVLLAALILLAAWWRRRKQQRYADEAGSDAGLAAPLAGGGSVTGGSSFREDLSIASASPSDIFIRVPGASAGGAPPPPQPPSRRR